MKTPKKETKEVINEAGKEVTGKSIEEKKAELIAGSWRNFRRIKN